MLSEPVDSVKSIVTPITIGARQNH